MGTRADFYIQRGELNEATYLGSIAWDGYPEGIDDGVLDAPNEENFVGALRAFASKRDDDWSTPEKHGWPWPWEDSNTSDYAYVLSVALGRVEVYCFGGKRVKDDDGEWLEVDDGPADFPNMTDLKNVTMGPRSGLIVLGL